MSTNYRAVTNPLTDNLTYKRLNLEHKPSRSLLDDVTDYLKLQNDRELDGQLTEADEEALDDLRQSLIHSDMKSGGGLLSGFFAMCGGLTIAGAPFAAVAGFGLVGAGAIALVARRAYKRASMQSRLKKTTKGWVHCAPFISTSQLRQYAKVVGEDAVLCELAHAKIRGWELEKSQINYLRNAWEGVGDAVIDGDWRYEIPPDNQAIAAIAPTAPTAPTVSPTATATETRPISRSLYTTLADNPFLCYFILASQRTGKTSSAAAASWVVKREKGTEVFYINLSDHGQGNRESFAHADRVAVGDINSGDPAMAKTLIKEAIAIIEQFHRSHNAILVVDEWVNLSLKVRTNMDELWDVLSPKAAALTSNGIGCGRSVWAIAPTFQAAVVRDEAKVVKNFVPLILSVAPGQSIEWSNPVTGVVSRIPYNGSLVGQSQKNWPDADIKEPSADEARYWQQEGVSRVFWADGMWSPLDPPPQLPKPAAVGSEINKKIPHLYEAIARMTVAQNFPETEPVDKLTGQMQAVYAYAQKRGVPISKRGVQRATIAALKDLSADDIGALLELMVEDGYLYFQGDNFTLNPNKNR